MNFTQKEIKRNEQAKKIIQSIVPSTIFICISLTGDNEKYSLECAYSDYSSLCIRSRKSQVKLSV